MLFFICDEDLSKENKEKLREMIRERTGEDSIFLGPHFKKVCSIPVKNEAAPASEAGPKG